MANQSFMFYHSDNIDELYYKCDDVQTNYKSLIIEQINHNKDILLRIEKLFSLYKSSMCFSYHKSRLAVNFDSNEGKLVRFDTHQTYFNTQNGVTKCCDFCAGKLHYYPKYYGNPILTTDKNANLYFKDDGEPIFSIDPNCYIYFKQTLNLTAFYHVYSFIYCVSINNISLFDILNNDIMIYLRKLIINYCNQ